MLSNTVLKKLKFGILFQNMYLLRNDYKNFITNKILKSKFSIENNVIKLHNFFPFSPFIFCYFLRTNLEKYL